MNGVGLTIHRVAYMYLIRPIFAVKEPIAFLAVRADVVGHKGEAFFGEVARVGLYGGHWRVHRVECERRRTGAGVTVVIIHKHGIGGGFVGTHDDVAVVFLPDKRCITWRRRPVDVLHRCADVQHPLWWTAGVHIGHVEIGRIQLGKIKRDDGVAVRRHNGVYGVAIEAAQCECATCKGVFAARAECVGECGVVRADDAEMENHGGVASQSGLGEESVDSTFRIGFSSRVPIEAVAIQLGVGSRGAVLQLQAQEVGRVASIRRLVASAGEGGGVIGRSLPYITVACGSHRSVANTRVGDECNGGIPLASELIHDDGIQGEDTRSVANGDNGCAVVGGYVDPRASVGRDD